MPTEGDQREASGRSGLIRLGLTSWALIGIVLVLAGAAYVAGQLSLVVVPLVLALFPAALLAPASEWLKRHRVPPAAASLLTIIGAIALITGVLAALVPLVIADLPQLIDSGTQGLQQLQAFIEDDPMGLGLGGVEQLLQQAQEFVGEAGEIAGQAFEALVTVFEAAAALIFLLVALFFYLKDDGRIARGIGDLIPARLRTDTAAIVGRVWDTLGGFFRGQLFVALVDAVFIGLGLVILGIPLALPLAVLVFFGGLFPIIGAFLTGTLAVLVALAHGGIVLGLVVLALVVGVQQLESNVLEPVVLGRVIRLHPLLVITAVAGGAITLGVLGAFLAVPIVASIARVVEYLRERDAPDTDEPGERDARDTSEPARERAGDQGQQQVPEESPTK